MNIKYKTIAWREIAEELGQPVGVCKNRWQDIRTSYRKFRARSNDTRTHKYEDKLQFLTPFYTEWEVISSLADSMGESSRATNGPPTSTSPPNSNDDAGEQSNGTDDSEKPSPQKRKRWNLQEEVAENWENRLTACTELIDQVVRRRTQSPWNTPLGLFFEGALINVSRLKRRNQTKVQQKILELISKVQDAEDEENS